MSPKRRLFLTTGDSVLSGMDYFISVHPRSNVRFNALFPDTEDKSAFCLIIRGCVLLYDNVLRFEYEILADTMADVNVNVPTVQAPAMALPARTDEQILPRIR
ncbi:hypothetical protein Tco_0245992 [Tanacetum coccineum]